MPFIISDSSWSRTNGFKKAAVQTALALLFTIPSGALALTTPRTVRVNSVPQGATVATNGVTAGVTPLVIKDFPFDKQTVLKVQVSAPGYETQTLSKNRADADAIPRKLRDEPGMVFEFQLLPLEVKIPARFDSDPGTRFLIEGTPVEADSFLTFKRDTSSSPWETLTMRAERKDYEPVEMTLSKEAVEASPLAGDRKSIRVNLFEIRHLIPIRVTANVDDSQVYVNDTNLHSAGPDNPAMINLEFRRADHTKPWSENLLKVSKDGYEWRPPAPAETLPEFTTNLTFDLAKNLQGRLAVMNFQPLKQLPAPWLRVVVNNGDVSLGVTNVFSAITPGGTVNQFNPDFLDDGELFIGDRIGTVPPAQDSLGNGKPLPVIVAVAKRAIRDGVPAEVVGSELAKVYPPPAKKVEKLTSMGAAQGTYDLQPCMSSDGKYIYFSSNRSDDGQYHIFRIRADASRYLEEISHPQPGIDMEPTVYTDHDGKSHLAFTRYPAKSAIHAEPHIMVQTSEGGFAQVGDPGSAPCWSHDGTRIAYVSTKGKICVMTPEDGSRVELEMGTAPAWLPGDKHIVYSKPNGNSFGLSIIDVDGSNGVNPISDATSFYSFPTVSYDDQKTYIYFVSNRQIQQRGDPKCWALYYIEWKN